MKTVTHESATAPAGGSHTARLSTVELAWDRLVADVLQARFALMVILAVAIVAAGQVAEDITDSQPIEMLQTPFLGRRWTIIIVVFYMLVIGRIVDRTVQHSLPAVGRAIRTDAATFRAHARQLQPPGVRTSIVVLGVSALVVTVLFGVMGSDLPLAIGRQPVYLPANAAGLVILAGYAIVGWAGLSLVFLTIQTAGALGEISQEPLEIDVFDTANLLPFGNIALAAALAPAGVIVILLLGLGQPTSWLSWTVLLLAAVASVLALILPLRCVHVQMSNAKVAVLADINARLSQLYGEVRATATNRGTDVAMIGERTNTLILLRKAVHDMTTWPFADTVAFGRAILIASAPLIYTSLSELIKVFWIGPLTR